MSYNSARDGMVQNSLVNEKQKVSGKFLIDYFDTNRVTKEAAGLLKPSQKGTFGERVWNETSVKRAKLVKMVKERQKQK